MSWENYSDELRKSSSDMGEDNDCTVRAWCNVFDAQYIHAHAWLKKFGRQNKRGMTRKQITTALESCKKAIVKKGPYSKDNRITVKQFCKKHPIGRFYVASSGHAFCIKNGVVNDWKYGPGRQITLAFRVYLEGEV